MSKRQIFALWCIAVSAAALIPPAFNISDYVANGERIPFGDFVIFIAFVGISFFLLVLALASSEDEV